MHVIEQGYELLSDISSYGLYELGQIEQAARTCYRSEDKIDDLGISAQKMVKKLIDSGHEAMLEHSILTVRFTCDRAIANELVRHRMASFAQESTRYCNYSKDKFSNELNFIKPSALKTGSPEYGLWISSCYADEEFYMQLIKQGVTPEIARAVLPQCLAAKIVVSANYREWRHIFKLRTAKDAHPQMRELLIPLLEDLKERIPIVFDDIKVEE